MLLDQLGPGGTDDPAQDERDEERIVELAGDGNEVRNQVERQQQIRDERREHELVTARHTRIAKEPSKEHDTVGYEPGNGTRMLPAAEQHEHKDERGVEDEHDADEYERNSEAGHDNPTLSGRSPGPSPSW